MIGQIILMSMMAKIASTVMLQTQSSSQFVACSRCKGSGWDPDVGGHCTGCGGMGFVPTGSSRITVGNPGSSSFKRGQTVSLTAFMKENKRIIASGRKPAEVQRG